MIKKHKFNCCIPGVEPEIFQGVGWGEHLEQKYLWIHIVNVYKHKNQTNI